VAAPSEEKENVDGGGMGEGWLQPAAEILHLRGVGSAGEVSTAALYHPDGDNAGWNDKRIVGGAVGGSCFQFEPSPRGTTGVPGVVVPVAGREGISDAASEIRAPPWTTSESGGRGSDGALARKSRGEQVKKKQVQTTLVRHETLRGGQSLRERVKDAAEQLHLQPSEIVRLFLPLRGGEERAGGGRGGGQCNEDTMIFVEEAVTVLEEDLGVLVNGADRAALQQKFGVRDSNELADHTSRGCMVDAAILLQDFGLWEEHLHRRRRKGSGLLDGIESKEGEARMKVPHVQEQLEKSVGQTDNGCKAARGGGRFAASGAVVADPRHYADGNDDPFGNGDRGGIVNHFTAEAIERYWQTVEPETLKHWEKSSQERLAHVSPERRLRFERRSPGGTTSELMLPSEAFPWSEGSDGRSGHALRDDAAKGKTRLHWNAQAQNSFRATETHEGDRGGDPLTPCEAQAARTLASAAEIDYRNGQGVGGGGRVRVSVMRDSEWVDTTSGCRERSAEVRLPRTDGLVSNFDIVARGDGRAGVVASHEGRFAAAVVRRGWEGLSRLDDLLSGHYRSCENCFLSPLDLSHCLCQAGIDLNEDVLGEFLLGLGCDGAGRVDASEVLHAIEDVLAAEKTSDFKDLLGPFSPHVGGDVATELSEAPYGRSRAAENPAKYALPWLDDWVKPSAPSTDDVAAACQELEDQAALFRDLPLDPDERAQVFARNFHEIDTWRGPLPAGSLPLHTFAKALHSIGFDLSRREAAVIGFAFRVRSSSGGSGESSMRYHPHMSKAMNPGRAPSLYDCAPGTRVFYRNVEGLEADTTGIGMLHSVLKARSFVANPEKDGSLSKCTSGALAVECGTADGLWYTGTILGALDRGLALVRFDDGQGGAGNKGGERRVPRSSLRLFSDPDDQPRVE
jgi:hypothetical protein